MFSRKRSWLLLLDVDIPVEEGCTHAKMARRTPHTAGGHQANRAKECLRKCSKEQSTAGSLKHEARGKKGAPNPGTWNPPREEKRKVNCSVRNCAQKEGARNPTQGKNAVKTNEIAD